MNLSTVDLSNLHDDPANPRTHDDANLAAISASLDEHGQVEPIVVQRGTGMVIAGNGRVAAMRALGWKRCSAVMLDVDDHEARALSIRLNRTAEMAGWDDDVLGKHLAELSSLSRFDVSDFGFDDSALDALVQGFADSTLEAEPDDTEDTSDDDTPSADSDDDSGRHAQPSDMRASKGKETRLYLSPEDDEVFQYRVRRLAEEYGLDNVTDTVVEAVAREHARVTTAP